MSFPKEALSRAFSQGHPALVTYMMAGYPDQATSEEALRVLAKSGVDVVELGVPYADPLADGPTIVKAANKARAAAAREALDTPGRSAMFSLAETIDLARRFNHDEVFLETLEGERPALVLMTYYNLINHMGLEKTAALMADAGIAGIIVADMPPEAATAWLAASRPLGIATVFLTAPTSTPERIRAVLAAAEGFVYCVSATGVTGERSELDAGLADQVHRIKEESVALGVDLPIAVGFGISTPEQAASVAAIAEGVIVGSGVVRRQDDLSKLATFAGALAQAVHNARTIDDARTADITTRRYHHEG